MEWRADGAGGHLSQQHNNTTIIQQYNNTTNKTTRIPFKRLETRLEEGGDRVTPVTLASILLGIEGKS